LRLPKIILIVIEVLQRDLTSLLSPAAPSDVNLRSLGHAYGLAALVAIIPERPLYVSYDVSAKVLDMATQLLKGAGEHDVKIASVEIEVAWTSIASLMSLGPNFVRPHLPQLLVLWRNALPKPTSKDTASGASRSAAEWTFLLHLRESALDAILCFLRHNSFLVTLDVARRIASLLGNALSFANTFISKNVEDQSEPALRVESAGLSLRSKEALLRRRVYQCFTALGFSSITESTQSTLLQSVVSLFASPDGYVGSSTQAAIATSSGTFTSVWQSIDGYAYGVTFIEAMDPGATTEDSSLGKMDQLNRDTIEMSIDAMVWAMSRLVTARPLTRNLHSCASQFLEHASTILFPFAQIVPRAPNIDSRSLLLRLLLSSMLLLIFLLDCYPFKTSPPRHALCPSSWTPFAQQSLTRIPDVNRRCPSTLRWHSFLRCVRQPCLISVTLAKLLVIHK
jgi:hypothetical protein